MSGKTPQSVQTIPSAQPSSNKPAPVRRSTRAEDSSGLAPKRSSRKRASQKQPIAASSRSTGCPSGTSVGNIKQKPQQKTLHKPQTVLSAAIATSQTSIASQADPMLQSNLPAHSGQAISSNRTAHPSQSASPSKQSQLIELLHQPAGASLADLMQATGWQAHSVRGVISGVLRKRLGLAVIRQADQDGKRIYRIKPVMDGAETDSAEMTK